MAKFEIFDEDVGLGSKLAGKGLAVGMFEVDGQGAFVAVDAEEIGRHEIVGRASEGWAPLAGVVAALGVFDFDDIGTKIAEEHGAERAGEDAGEIEDFEVG